MADDPPPTGRLLLVANRLPITAKMDDDGRLQPSSRSSGGLATGLWGPHQRSGGLWIGWPGELQLDEAQQQELNEKLGELRALPVYLTQDEINEYYENMANGVLWPLFHYLIDQLPDDLGDWNVFRSVNQKFAQAVIDNYQPGDLIWVQDYHLMLVPAMLRRALPDARIGFFLHVPFPSSEVFSVLPWREEILTGLLGADLIGFHTPGYMRHFTTSLRRVLGVDVEVDRLWQDDREVRLGVFPMGVDAAAGPAAATATASRRRCASLREDAAGRKIIVGIDRLDYTKGIPRRLLAIDRLFTEHPELCDNVRVIQVTVPSREHVEQYVEFKRRIDEMVGRINSSARDGQLDAHPPPLPLDLAGGGVRALSRGRRHARDAGARRHEPRRQGVRRRAHGRRRRADPQRVRRRRDGDGRGAARQPLRRRALRRPHLRGAGDAAERAPGADAGVARARADARCAPLGGLLHQGARRRRRRRTARSSQLSSPAEPRCGRRAGAAGARDTADPRLRRHARAVRADPRRGGAGPGAARPAARAGSAPAHARARDQRPHALVTRPLARRACRSASTPSTGSGRASRRTARGASCARCRRQWKEKVRPVMEHFVGATRGSFIEEKTGSLAWHYRLAKADFTHENDFGEFQAKELRLLLGEMLSNVPVQVLAGHKVVEVRPQGVHKGMVVPVLLSTIEDDGVVFAMGDDRTDEDLFAALPDDALTVHVGTGMSLAHYRIGSVDDARRLLREFLD